MMKPRPGSDPNDSHTEEELAQDEQTQIAALRQQIDAMDEQIVHLISQRATAAATIGHLKRDAELPVYEPKREEDVFHNVRRLNPGPLGDAELIHVYERIIDVMRTLQRRDAK